MNFTEEARQLLNSLASNPDNYFASNVQSIAAALQSAYERGRLDERERCANLCEDKANKHGWNYNLPSVGRELAEAIRKNQP